LKQLHIKLKFSLFLQFCCFLGACWSEILLCGPQKKMEDKVVIGLKKFEKHCFTF